MKPLNEGFRAYSSHAPRRELRPPKLSVPRSSQPRQETTDARPLPAWVTYSVLAAAGVVVLVLLS